MDTAGIKAFLLAEHAEILQETLDCADAVYTAWERDTVTDSALIVQPLRAMLQRTGVLERYPAVLTQAVAAGGGTLQATPVAGPPYVVVTSTGPVLRATFPDGRLIIRVEVFDVVGRSPPVYTRTTTPSDDALSVDYR